MRWARLLAAAYFTWAAARGLQAIVWSRASASYYFYEAVGTPGVHFLLSGVQALVAGIAAILLWGALRNGMLYTLLAAFVLAALSWLQAVDTSANLEIARSSYLAYREARGLSVPAPEALATIISPAGIVTIRNIGILMSLAAGVLGFLGLTGGGGVGGEDARTRARVPRQPDL